MTKAMYFFIILAVILGIVSIVTKNETSDSVQVVESELQKEKQTSESEGLGESKVDLSDLIIVSNPEVEEVIESPLLVSGVARGNWFFEGSFPVELKNADGVVIAKGIATTTEDWMTTEFIPFSTTLEFENPYQEDDPEYWKQGTLVLKRDNPSELPENDQVLEVTIYFEP